MEHTIKLSLPQTFELENTDLRLEVRSDGERLGEILASRGSIDWRPSGYSKTYELSWEKFAQIMEREGQRKG